MVILTIGLRCWPERHPACDMHREHTCPAVMETDQRRRGCHARRRGGVRGCIVFVTSVDFWLRRHFFHAAAAPRRAGSAILAPGVTMEPHRRLHIKIDGHVVERKDCSSGMRHTAIIHSHRLRALMKRSSCSCRRWWSSSSCSRNIALGG